MREYIAIVHEVNDMDMLVEYTAPGFAPVLVGVVRPLVGESFDDLIAAAAPTATWDWEERKGQRKQAVGLGRRFIAAPAAPVAAPEVERPARVRLGTTEVVL